MSKKIIINPNQGICWVPNCSQNQYSNCKKYYPLPPQNSKIREIWLALAKKPTKDFNLNEVFFCEDHFENNLSYDITINKILFKCGDPNMYTIPNKNMPDKICRICNTFVDIKEQLFVMSNSWMSHIPPSVSEELRNLEIEVNPEPLHHVFTFCFNEFVLPTDPLPLVCNKCFHHLWLFFAFKKRAIYVEDFLSQDLTPEKYGQMVLCRTCPDHCSNFFPIGRDSELGVVLQKMFVNNYSPDVVPLRVCLNCYNVLQRITQFHKTCINVEETIKRRALLCAKLKTNNGYPNVSSPTKDHSSRQALSKKVEKENMILANLMLQFGHALRADLHIIDNWKPICLKLQEQGINHKVPSLINNWKKMSNIAHEKVRKNIPLSDLEHLVCQFYQVPSTINSPFEVHPKTTGKLLKDIVHSQSVSQCNLNAVSSPNTQNNNRMVTPTRRSFPPSTTLTEAVVIEDVNSSINSTTPLSEREKLDLIDVMFKYRNEKGIPKDVAAFCDIWPDIEKILRYRGIQRNIELIKETWQDMKKTTEKALASKASLNESQKLVAEFLFNQKGSNKISTPNNKKESVDKPASKKEVNKSTADIISKRGKETKKPDKLVAKRKLAVISNAHIKRPSTSYEDKLAFAKGLSSEYNKLTREELQNRGIWKLLVRRVMENYMPKHSFNKLLGLWSRLRISASIHEKNGVDPIDIIIWEILQKYQKDKPASPVKRPSKNVPISKAAVEKATKSLIQDMSTNSATSPLRPELLDSNATATSKPAPSTVQKRVHEESLPKSGINSAERKSKKVKFNITDKNSDPNRPSTSTGTSSGTQGSSRMYQVLLRAGKDSQTVSDEQLFSLIKCAYKELRGTGHLSQGFVWRQIINKLYDDGFQGMKKPEAKATWHRIRQATAADVHRGKQSLFSLEVNRFLLKVRKEKVQFPKVGDVPTAKKKSPPNKKKPYETDVSYRPNRAGVVLAIKTGKEEGEDKIPRRSAAPVNGLFLVDNVEEEEKTVKPKKSTVSTHHWSVREKEDFLDIISQNLHYIHSNDSFWAKVIECHEAKGYSRSSASIRQQWSFMRKRVETKINEKTLLSDIEKKVEQIITQMKQLRREPPKPNIDETPKSTKLQNDIPTMPSESVKSLKRELMSPTKETETIDLTLTYDYVSLEDLQQSANWDMPTLQPMIESEEKEKEKMKFVVTKVEGGVEYESGNSQIEAEEDEDSRDSDSNGYVGASDFMGAEDLLCSDED